MKKTVTLALASTLLLALLAGCTSSGATGIPGAAGPSLADAKPTATQTAENFSDEMKIPYAMDLSPEDGADSVERDGDHVDSPYFSHPDFYNMTTTDTLTILPKFQTMQQTSEWSCGVTSALMVLNYYGKLGDWNEETLAALRRDSTEGATSLRQAIDIFDGVGGFTNTSTYDYQGNMENITLDLLQSNLKDGVPVMIGWNDWGGHWQVVIGYDDMGTETTQDDVLVVADPYDTTDQNQDGYAIYGAERFYYNWTMYDFFEGEDLNDMLFLAVKPAA